jgi:hypothetical protein
MPGAVSYGVRLSINKRRPKSGTPLGRLPFQFSAENVLYNPDGLLAQSGFVLLTDTTSTVSVLNALIHVLVSFSLLCLFLFSPHWPLQTLAIGDGRC